MDTPQSGGEHDGHHANDKESYVGPELIQHGTVAELTGGAGPITQLVDPATDIVADV